MADLKVEASLESRGTASCTHTPLLARAGVAVNLCLSLFDIKYIALVGFNQSIAKHVPGNPGLKRFPFSSVYLNVEGYPRH